MVELEDEKIRKVVRESYGKVAENANIYSCCGPTVIPTEVSSGSCCGPSVTPTESSSGSCCGSSVTPTESSSGSCCGSSVTPTETSSDGRSVIAKDRSLNTQNYSSKMRYSEEELKSVPKNANLGLGCGNPTALASVKEGETVIDLGSGAGIDCFLAANKVGKTGKVIGVDMTSQMLDNARENARKGDYENVEFRLGEIENLPVADNTADLIISNCVINLSPDKQKVYQEAFRVLKPGGRVMVSDIVLNHELPLLLKQSLEAYVACVSGAMKKEDYLNIILKAGFHDVELLKETNFPIAMMITDQFINELQEKHNLTSEQVGEIRNFKGLATSMEVRAFKPQ